MFKKFNLLQKIGLVLCGLVDWLIILSLLNNKLAYLNVLSFIMLISLGLKILIVFYKKE